MKKSGLHTLTLAFTPLSNQEAEWMWKDKEVRELVSKSKLYMIGQRRQIRFVNSKIDTPNGILTFDLECGDDRIEGVELDINQFDIPDGYNYVLEFGPKLIRLRQVKIGEVDTLNGEIIHWFTPDKLFMFYSRDEVAAKGLDDFRKFTDFELYYVGISKAGDSFTRLFKTGHEKRSRILGNESQIECTARLSDELMIFLFNVEDLQMITYNAADFDDNAPDLDLGEPIDPAALAADAEKAFINILQAKYNEVTYDSYPRSRDGLWGKNFDRYAFVINDAISFRTSTAKINGGRIYGGDEGDIISIEGDAVSLITVEHMKAKLASRQE